MNLHDLITLMILAIGKSGTNEIQYIKSTSEYILKLQIHQHLVYQLLLKGCSTPYLTATIGRRL